MANLNSIAKKLQKAILQKGLVIKMGTSQFYSVEQNRLITMYILSTRVLERKKNGEWKYYDYEIIRTASQIEIVSRPMKTRSSLMMVQSPILLRTKKGKNLVCLNSAHQIQIS